ncbi:hypothetical protein IKS57_03650 [bacterium]|nr:hypothetical protein [bacterium]
MTRELIVSLLIPYANYDVSYDTTNMEGLDETKALILLAIASNKQKNPTDKLKDVLHNFYHLNDNYDDFFIEELNNLIKNKTITNKVNDLASLDSYIGNFNIDSKIQSFLDDKSGFYGNSKNKQTHSLSLRIGLFTSQNYLEYNINDKNLVPYNEENGCAKFIDLNLTNNNKYNDAIVEYINNKKISENENLLDVNYKNEEEIKEATNLIYLKTDCKFKIDIDNNHFAKISYIEQLGERIYDNYYLRRTFYQNLLQLLCDQISFLQLENSSNVIPEINDLSDSLEF